jgi:cell division septal protein FtsQ
MGGQQMSNASVETRATRDWRARRARATRALFGLVVLMLLLTASIIAGMLWSSGWLPGQLVPRKLVVRGCEMSSSDEVLAMLDFTGNENLLQLITAAHAIPGQQHRWLVAVRLRPWLGRECVVEVHERRPLLAAIGHQQKYWICDDGSLVERQDEYDVGAAFEAVRRQPLVVISAAGEGSADVDTLLLLASCCQQAMPGVIRKIEQRPDGQYLAYDQRNFKVLLGGAEQLPEKIAALPKALRLCEDKREQLLYLDASNPQRFYMKWRETAPLT